MILVHATIFDCGLIYLFVVILYSILEYVVSPQPEEEVEVSLVVYVNFIAACQVHCIILCIGSYVIDLCS